MKSKYLKIFLIFAIGFGFLSAVADRLGMWPAEISAWGNWQVFLAYTKMINPFLPENLIPFTGMMATFFEVIFGVFIIIGFKTELFAKLSGYLILLFALAITFSSGIKGAFDFSVFAASGAAFALSTMKNKYFELDMVLSTKHLKK